LKNYNLVIIGSGPAGLCAAIEASNYIENILIIDENITPGGQLNKQTHMFFGNEEYYAGVRGFEIAKILVDKVKSSKNIELLLETTVTAIYENNEILYYKDEKLTRISSKSIIVATGASEKILTFPGSDLPGVYGAGAVQTLMNEYLVKPGNDVLMIGAGNIGLIVSYQMLQAGINVKALVEASANIGGYLVHANKLKRHQVPIYTKHTIKNAFGNEKVEYATICEVDDNFNIIEGTDKIIKVDTICIAAGLTPLTDLLHHAKVEIKYNHYLGGYVAKHDKNLQTSNPSIFIAGDVSGIEEATTAMIEGKIAGLNSCLYIKKNNLETEITNKINKLSNDLYIMRNNPFGIKAVFGKKEFYEDYLEYNQNYKHIEKSDILIIKNSNKPLPIIDCMQNIPCNPCVNSCKVNAITMDDNNISSLPRIDYNKCISCLNCAKICPGLSIYFVNYNYDEENANIILPYELFFNLVKDQTVIALDKHGKKVCEAKLLKTIKTNSINSVTLVSLLVKKEYAFDVRSFTLKEEKVIDKIDFDLNKIDKETIICRCEDITYQDILDKIHKEGLTTLNEIKRATRATMGPCQGKNCHDIILKILSKELNIPIKELKTHTFRQPFKPIKMESIKDLYDKEIGE
jgi:thioredoxin reductase/Fe-S-cluster-containing hydrogenase component 2